DSAQRCSQGTAEEVCDDPNSHAIQLTGAAGPRKGDSQFQTRFNGQEFQPGAEPADFEITERLVSNKSQTGSPETPPDITITTLPKLSTPLCAICPQSGVIGCECGPPFPSPHQRVTHTFAFTTMCHSEASAITGPREQLFVILTDTQADLLALCQDAVIANTHPAAALKPTLLLAEIFPAAHLPV
ncbi:hypothetical protein BaRGS_00021844, partial [Batillaria attramentaria]